LVDWKSHLLFGFLFGAAIAYAAFHPPQQQLFSFAAVSGASALLPDLDCRKSKASQLLYAAASAAIIGGALFFSGGRSIWGFALCAALLFFALLALDFSVRPRHRGIMHSLAFLAAVAAASLLLFGEFFASAIAAGYFSHLLADSCIKPA